MVRLVEAALLDLWQELRRGSVQEAAAALKMRSPHSKTICVRRVHPLLDLGIQRAELQAELPKHYPDLQELPKWRGRSTVVPKFLAGLYVLLWSTIWYKRASRSRSRSGLGSDRWTKPPFLSSLNRSRREFT